MLRITQSNSSSGAKAYYASALKTADYYQEGQEKAGIWHGKAAQKLGLEGVQVEAEKFGELVEGEGISQRKIDNRKAGYDFTFNTPKSVSLIWSITQDDKFLEALESSTKSAMQEVEKDMQARVRVNNQNSNRITGNMIYGAFTHTTTRPVEGTCDPHLHQHCFVMNGTFDPVEGKWKAAEIGNIKKDAVYYEAVFHAHLASEIKKMGYDIEPKGRFWEIEGIDRETVESFSRRTVEIEKRAEELGITYPDDKAKLGSMTRSRKSDNRSLSELFEEWPQRLNDDQKSKIDKVISDAGSKDNAFTHNKPEIAKHLLDFHIEKQLENNSVLPEKRIFDSVLRSGIGRITNDDLKEAYAARTDLIKGQNDGRSYITTLEVEKEEMEMLAYARNGISTLPPINYGDHDIKRSFLNDQQKGAVKHILGARDRVSIISGGAGVGKTTLMKEAIEAMKAEIEEGASREGHKVFTFAPTHGAKDVLQDDGFKEASTLASLLTNADKQDEVKNSIIWVDEAGLISTPDMANLFKVAQAQNARVILSGDTKQHSSIQRGEALRLLQEKAKIEPAHVREIMRQTGAYKRAVFAASQGQIESAWSQFKDMGAVKEVSSDKLAQNVAADYIGELETGKTVLVVAPTNKTKNEITGHIREGLKHSGSLDKQDHKLKTLQRVYLSEPEKALPENIKDGQILHFVKDAKTIKRGSHLLISATDKDGHKVGFDSEGNRFLIPLTNTTAFNVYDEQEKDFAIGEKIRITANGQDLDEKRINNGDSSTITGFNENGDLLLENGKTIDKNWGHIDYGYTSTGYSAQGKTVDVVINALPASDVAAMNAASFYVAVSRGRGNNASNIRIYSDDVETVKDRTKYNHQRLGVSEIDFQRPEESPATTFTNQLVLNQEILRQQSKGQDISDDELMIQAGAITTSQRERGQSYDL